MLLIVVVDDEDEDEDDLVALVSVVGVMVVVTVTNGDVGPSFDDDGVVVIALSLLTYRFSTPWIGITSSSSFDFDRVTTVVAVER